MLAGAKVLGIDPGTAESGWALVECVHAFQGRWLEVGNIENRFESADELIARLKPDKVVVEEPRWIGNPKVAKAGAALFQTNSSAGRWHWLARARGILAEMVYAAECRLWLTGSVSPSDAVVKACLLRVLLGVPPSSNSHQRDAAAVAWAGLRLPPNWTEMRRLAAEHKAKAAGVKAGLAKRRKAMEAAAAASRGPR